MRFQCPNCETWQTTETSPEESRPERTCQTCGALMSLHAVTDEEGTHWEAREQQSEAVEVGGEDPVRELLDQVADATPALRADRLTGVRAQLVSLTASLTPRLWLPAALLVAMGLALGIGLVVVGQRIERSLGLLAAPLALGLVAWAMVVAASAVANLLHVRLGGNQVGMGRSLRMMFEHGNGAAGSALRFVVLGVVGATLCALVALLAVVPGLAGDGGLAVTGGLFWLQLLAIMGAIGLLFGMSVALLLHPGLACTRSLPAPRVFRFVLGLLRREGRAVLRRAAVPLCAAAGLTLLGTLLLHTALGAVVALNGQVLGDRYADLVAASPIRVLFGTPELLDPGTALGVGGFLMAVSLTLCAALVLGFVAVFLGISGYLLTRGLDLPDRL